MNRNRQAATMAGALLLIAWVTGAASMGLSRPVLDGSDYLIWASANMNQAAIGALFYFVMAAACAGIAIALYPAIKPFGAGLALGSVGFRIIESAIYMVGVIISLSLLTLSQQFKVGAPAASSFQAMGDLLLAVNEQISVVGMAAFSLGAMMYYYIFYQSKLIPRWLSGWGLVGATLAMIATMLVMLRFISPLSAPQTVAYLPVGLQELVLGVWLIVKGFDPSAMAFESPRADISASQLSASEM